MTTILYKHVNAAAVVFCDADLKAVNQQNKATQMAATMRERANRTPQQWQELYDAAMAEKRAAS